jgi:tetratricopeptide (TPR) repeat protein
MTNQSIVTKPLVSLLSRAHKLREEEKYLAATEIYAEIVERFGQDADLCSVLAHCYFAASFQDESESSLTYVEKAISWMQRGVLSAPATGRMHADLAQFYWLGKLDYANAAEEYRTAITLSPNDVKALVGAAALYGVPEEVVTLDEAIIWLEQAVSLEPDDPNYHARLGQLYAKDGRPLEARREWIKAFLCSRPLNPRSMQTVEIALTSHAK